MSDAYTIHPFAAIIPEMSERDYQELKADIENNGQLEPILIYRGQVIDGRHRLKACQELGRTPVITDLSNSDNLKVVEMIWSANVTRRHLTDDQRVALATQSAAADLMGAAPTAQCQSPDHRQRRRGALPDGSG